ncbi:MAG TPA: GxGYxYP domain-containing protein [Ktedonobacteraceae bacterium]
MNIRTEAANANWSNETLLPAFQPPEHLDVYDIRGAQGDVQRTVTMLAGLINRPRSKIYLVSRDDDLFWLNEALASIPHTLSPARGNDILDTLLKTYRDSIQGLIIYNPNFIDSINIAMMMAGQHDGMVVSPDQAEQLQQSSYKLPVLADLRNYHWKSRVQAYNWALSNLRRDASSQVVAGFNPTIVGALQSYLVATRAFVYWLHPLNFLPDFTQGLLSERSLMKRIFRSFEPGAVHLGWFISEPFGVRLTSDAGLPVFASDFSNNLEVWTSIQNNKHGETSTPDSRQIPVSQTNQANTPLNERQNGPGAYVSFTMSEGDNIQYIQHRMVQLWNDPARGSIPLGWTISPVLGQAIPPMAAYYRRTATTNDEFLAGPSGAGYMYPSRWPKEHLPAYLQLTGRLMQNMNLSILQVLDAGFLGDLAFLNKDLQQHYVDTLKPFGLKGILSGSGLSRARWNSISGVPIYQNLGLADSVDKTVRLVRNASPASRFLNVYIFAYKMTPSDVKQVTQQLGGEYEVVTPGKLLAMLAKENS